MTINRTKAPAFKEISKLQYTKPVKIILPNGIPVFSIKGGDRDVVRCDFLFDAGLWYQQDKLVASTTNALLLEGSRNMDAHAIAEKIDFHGAYINVNTDFHYASISLVCLHKHLETMLELMREIIFYPSFSEKELENYLKKRKQTLILELDKVNTLARRKFLESIFGDNHPYGQQVIPEDYEIINSGQLSAFHNGLYNKGNCSIIIAGKVDKKVLTVLDKFFGGSDFSGEKPENIAKEINHPNPTGLFVIPKNDVLQSAIRVGKRTINKNHQDYPGLQVVNTIFGGYFGSRLMSNIREDKGYTYGIGSILSSFRNEGYFAIVSEVGASVCEDALKEIKLELKRLRQEHVPADELKRVKNYMLGEMIKIFDGPFSQADTFNSIYEYDMGYDYYERLFQTIKNISSEEIIKLANDYLHEDTLFEVVAGKK